MVRYRPRVVDDQVNADLRAVGAVVVEGPRACGKTSTAQRAAANAVRLDVDDQQLVAARLDPALVPEGPTPRLLDEWQLASQLWNAVRRAVDDRGATWQFILTGSAMPVADARRHSGAGRMAVVRMRPMSLWEAGASTGDVPLGDLFDGGSARGRATLAVPDYVTHVVRGGWPGQLDAPVTAARRFLRGYIDLVVERDISALDGRRRDPARLRRFLHAYAHVSAQTASLNTIAKRVRGDVGDGLTWRTVDAYRDAAERLMLI